MLLNLIAGGRLWFICGVLCRELAQNKGINTVKTNKKGRRNDSLLNLYVLENYFPLFTEPASSDPALNFTTFLALILISFPVCGLRPVRAARLATEKDPKPTNPIRSPFLRAL